MVTALCVGAAMASQAFVIRVDGEGYLRMVDQGRVVFAKRVSVAVRHGSIVSEDGDPFLPNIESPTGAVGIKVDLQGRVTAELSGKTVPLGRLVLALFPPGASLESIGNYFTARDRPTLGDPGDGVNGVIRCDRDVDPIRTNALATQSKTATKTVAPAEQRAEVSLPAGKIAEIVVHDESMAGGANFTLDDIAQIRASASVRAELGPVVMGRTPVIGVDRGLDLSQITTSLRAVHLRPEDYVIVIPPGAKVSRTFQTVTSDQLLQAASQAVAEKFGADTKFTLKDPGYPVRIEPGAVTFRTESCSRTLDGVTAILAIDVDGRQATTRIVNLVPQGGSIGVRSGQSVKVTVRSGGATVVVTGTAQNDAWIGQPVSVVATVAGANGSDRVSLAATVTGSGTVEVRN